MSIDRATIKKLGRLSRIRISEDQEAHLAEEVSGILGWIEQLGEVNTDGVEPMTSVTDDMELKQRKDEVTDGGIQKDILKNAPETTQGYFVVPKVVE